MCNLYNITTNQDAIRGLAKLFDDIIGNLEPSIDVYPGCMGPLLALLRMRAKRNSISVTNGAKDGSPKPILPDEKLTSGTVQSFSLCRLQS